ncbi:MAG TPA: alkaline phosphatase family protein [Candidatus Binataceae bacterium]|nr:alkaline phosphatase family protein [Candidatus Binataceae bacterium]
MRVRRIRLAALFIAIGMFGVNAATARADGNLWKVKHLVIVMQENRSFDNFLGALTYAPGSPYHTCSAKQKRSDHRCVDGLTCTVDSGGNFTCANSNPDEDGNPVFAYHDPRLCDVSGLDHGWEQSHHEANWQYPDDTFNWSPNNGFVLQNDTDNGPEQPFVRDTMGFYTQDDLPVYYGLSNTFSIDDTYFCSVIGPTLPNRLYYMAGASFGHITTAEAIPPLPVGYRPLRGTLFDLMDKFNVSWVNYYSDIPSSAYIRAFISPHIAPITQFATDAAAGNLPDFSLVDPNFGILDPSQESDGSPPNNVRRDDYFIWQIVNAVRTSPLWKDTIIIITKDEHGGTYDHVKPPEAIQNHAISPDGINPGQCADLSNPPASEQHGGGANCGFSQGEVSDMCPGFTPSGPYPQNCPNFNQYGFRVPLIAVSPFSKRHYVSHALGDHTSLVALIEKIFMTRKGKSKHPSLTLRDANADTLEDMFDFDHSPSLNAALPTPVPPGPDDSGCGG